MVPGRRGAGDGNKEGRQEGALCTRRAERTAQGDVGCEWKGSAENDSQTPALTTGWRLVPFSVMGKPWEDKIWVRGCRARVHLHTRSWRCQADIRRRCEWAAEYTSLHFRKAVWAGAVSSAVIRLKMIFKAGRWMRLPRKRRKREKAPRNINAKPLDRGEGDPSE